MKCLTGTSVVEKSIQMLHELYRISGIGNQLNCRSIAKGDLVRLLNVREKETMGVRALRYLQEHSGKIFFALYLLHA